MPDTFNRENSRFMNEIIFYKLREATATIRAMNEDGKPVAALREYKNEMMKTIYRILVIMLGEPPKKFDLVFVTRRRNFIMNQG